MIVEPETLAFIGTSDLSGLLRGVSVPWATLDAVMGRGVIVPGHVPLQPTATEIPVGGIDLLLQPDPATRAYVPALDAPDLVLLLADLLELDGAPWACCPRYFLRRAVAALHAEFGLTVQAGFGQRFLLPGGTAHGRTLGALRKHAAFCGTLLATLRANDIPVEALGPSDGVGAFELVAIDTAGVAAADRAVVARELIAASAALCGAGQPSLGTLTIGLSLRDGFGQSAMADSSGEHGLSDDAEHWAAGILHHLPALTAIVAPRGLGVARTAELAAEGRPGPLRLRMEGDDSGSAVPTRLELTIGDAGASPYLAMGALLWAGLDGLRRHRRLAEQIRQTLPSTAAEALAIWQESVHVAEWFGMSFREQFLRFSRASVGTIAR